MLTSALVAGILHPDDPMEDVVAALFVTAVGLYHLAQAVAAIPVQDPR